MILWFQNRRLECNFDLNKPNTLVSNHFHSVKCFFFSSARPHDFDGMLGT